MEAISQSPYVVQLIEWMGVIAVTLILGMSPRFARRPLIFKYPRRETVVALALYVLSMLILMAVFSAFFAPGQTAAPSTASGDAAFTYTTIQMTRQLGLVAAILFPFVLALIIRGQPPVSTGLSRQTTSPSLQLGVALGLITIFLRNRVYSILDGISPSEFNFLLVSLGIGFAEELIFRGYIQPRISSWAGVRWGWVTTAALYAFWHLPQKMIVEQSGLTDTAVSLGFLFIFGLILGWIMRKSGNILAPGFYHAIHNWVQVL